MNTTEQVEANPMLNSSVEIYGEGQKVLQDWYARRQKDSYEFQQLAMRVAQAKSPTEATTAWMEWSEQTMTSLTEEFQNMWSFTNQAAATDVKEMTPVKAWFDTTSSALAVNDQGSKRTSETEKAPASKAASKAKRAAPAKQASEAKPATKAKRSAPAKQPAKAKTAAKTKRAAAAKQASEPKLVLKNAKRTSKGAPRASKTSKK